MEIETDLFPVELNVSADFWYAVDIGVVQEIHIDTATGETMLSRELVSME